jgi:hypothetical protein
MNHFPRAVNKVVTEPPDPISYNRVAQYELEGEDNARQPFPPEVIFWGAVGNATVGLRTIVLFLIQSISGPSSLSIILLIQLCIGASGLADTQVSPSIHPGWATGSNGTLDVSEENEYEDAYDAAKPRPWDWRSFDASKPV